MSAEEEIGKLQCELVALGDEKNKFNEDIDKRRKELNDQLIGMLEDETGVTLKPEEPVTN